MRTKYEIKATLTALSVGVTLGLAGCGNNDSGGMGGMDHGSSSAPMSPAPPTSGSASTTAEFNDADVMFVRGMLPHHEQAVAMSDTLLARTRVSAQTTALAQQIKAAQQPEIDTMEGWLSDWGKSAEGGMGGMDHDMGGGMATDAELEELEQAQGAAAEKMFLEMMTKHHQGAIAMAKTEIGNGKNPDAVRMANSIVSSQQAEIDTMKKLLAQL
jgi:uncharacterized protein (DUF305 family)